MFYINFLPSRKFQVEYLKKNQPKLWNSIEIEIKDTIKGYILILSFCLFVALFFLGMINTVPESNMPSFVKWLCNIVIIIGCLIGVKIAYRKIIHCNNEYFDVPYMSKEFVAEMRIAESIFIEEKILNKIVSTNIVKEKSKKIAKRRL